MRFMFMLIAFMLLFLPGNVCSQDKKAYKKAFLEAEYFFLLEEYEEAVFLYRELLNQEPTNANLHFLLGACYLSIDGSKKRAIPHLEKAVGSVSAGYREGSYRESNAPIVAFYALARAYHINNQFDQAVEFYEKYKKVMRISEVAEVEFINKQLSAVRLAREYIKDTPDIGYILLDEPFTSLKAGQRAVFAEKDSIMLFISNKPFYKAIMMTRKISGNWTKPELINWQLQIDGKYELCSITYDGTELYISVYNNYKWDLYVSYFDGIKWSPAQALEKDINTKYNETHASLSRDKRIMYFTSDRPGGMGAMDIYFSERDPSGSWGKPVNPGKPVNSIYSEETPFITADGKTLYFSSMSHATMGGFDVFYSARLPDNSWSYPANLGFPVNTCDDDLFYVPLGNGNQAIYSSTAGILPSERIMIIDMTSGETVNKYAFRGKLTAGDKLDIDTSAVIKIIDTEKKKIIASLNPAAETGEFNVEIPPGSYQMMVNAEGYESAGEFINILPQHTSKSIDVETSLIPARVSVGDYALSRSILFGFDSHILSDESMHELEKLYRLISENPYLYVEVTGYTDAIGTDDYNLRLAGKRSEEVISYLVSKGIPRENFISKAAGKTGFIARNIRRDGTDDPEGRRFNRRVEINLINTGDKKIVMEDILVPEHLKPLALKQFYVILDEKEGKHKSIPAIIAEQNVKLYETGRKFIYAAGSFNTRHEAAVFLNEVIDTDYPDSRIISEQDFNYLLKPSVPNLTEVKGPFTIQLLALRIPVQTEFFKLSDKVMQIAGNDGFYRYITGVYEKFEDAQLSLAKFVRSGYTDAFINQLSRYSLATSDPEFMEEVDFYYTIQFSAFKNPVAQGHFKGIGNIVMTRGKDGFYRYSTGIFLNRTDAEKHLLKVKETGFTDSFIRKVSQ